MKRCTTHVATKEVGLTDPSLTCIEDAPELRRTYIPARAPITAGLHVDGACDAFECDSDLGTTSFAYAARLSGFFMDGKGMDKKNGENHFARN